ncbi:hypothetical protein EDB19DRAFT_1737857 [Suillus lakei]|nr:hypothetical protein EDB19DRAFT_1737857 [Suillus lakei]
MRRDEGARAWGRWKYLAWTSDIIVGFAAQIAEISFNIQICGPLSVKVSTLKWPVHISAAVGYKDADLGLFFTLTIHLNSIMSNLPEPPPSTEKLTVRKAFVVIGAGIYVLAEIIYTISIAVIFIHLGSTIPALKPYADYAAFYTLGARTVMFVAALLVGCCWCVVRLVKPKWAGSSISEWNLEAQAPSEPSDENLGRAWRIYFAGMGAINICNGLRLLFRSWKTPDSAVSDLLTSIIVLGIAAWSIHVAYVGRLPRHRGNNMAVGNNDSQPESDEVTPTGEYKDDDTTTQ